MNSTLQAVSMRRFSSENKTYFLFKLNRLNLVLIISILLFSAFAVVYLKDLNRRLFIRYQNLGRAEQQLNVDWGKLLLEQSAWSTQTRIQQVAEQKLNMVMPTPKQIVMVEEGIRISLASR